MIRAGASALPHAGRDFRPIPGEYYIGPLGESMNHGQIYVTLARLEKAGLVVCERAWAMGGDATAGDEDDEVEGG
ncbi:hypothetical protein [Microbispora triticiradicis]|uniref:hypothetical protein n=1 Tax=Microbispora triticiradicis TaxID=2200763 RepID=UPI00269A2D1A|nr:hypothetical protein [Microbispora triticiradicis]